MQPAVRAAHWSDTDSELGGLSLSCMLPFDGHSSRPSGSILLVLGNNNTGFLSQELNGKICGKQLAYEMLNKYSMSE